MFSEVSFIKSSKSKGFKVMKIGVIEDERYFTKPQNNENFTALVRTLACHANGR